MGYLFNYGSVRYWTEQFGLDTFCFVYYCGAIFLFEMSYLEDFTRNVTK